MSEHYRLGASNVHRGVYPWSVRATDRFEDTRRKVAAFIGAEDEREVIFTSGTTDSVNLLASTWGETNISEGDTIVVSLMEHHSNLLPWRQLAGLCAATVLAGTCTAWLAARAAAGRDVVLAVKEDW